MWFRRKKFIVTHLIHATKPFEIKDTYLHEIIDENGKPTKVVTKVDGNKFNEFWLKLMTQ